MQEQELPLRDIHLPPELGWWPPAIGWWLTLGILVGILAIVYGWYRYTKVAESTRAVALRELHAIESQFHATADTHVLLQQLSSLLRRVAMSYRGREQVASLTGSAWLICLDEIFQVDEFSIGVGQALTRGPYVKHVDVDGKRLLSLCRRALKRLPIPPAKAESQ